ncbi:MAG: hypothetical protein R2847_04325 [Bacteroidia bacterium]
MNTKINNGERNYISIHYSGQPQEGKMLPWDGGFKWTKDADDRPRGLQLPVRGRGASVWWPCKEHQSDEAGQYGNKYYRTRFADGCFKRKIA